MTCPLHPDTPRPTLCHDCRRAAPAARDTIELTQTCHGRLERYIIRLPGGRERIAFRPVGEPLKPKLEPRDPWGHYTR